MDPSPVEKVCLCVPDSIFRSGSRERNLASCHLHLTPSTVSFVRGSWSFRVHATMDVRNLSTFHCFQIVNCHLPNVTDSRNDSEKAIFSCDRIEC